MPGTSLTLLRCRKNRLNVKAVFGSLDFPNTSNFLDNRIL